MGEANGFLFSCILDGKGGGVFLDPLQTEKWRPEEGILWSHLDRTGSWSRSWLEQQKDLDPVIVETLLRKDGNRPRVQRVGDALLLSLRGINRTPGEMSDDMPSLHIWADQKKIITLRRRRLETGEQIRAEINSGRGPKDVASLLVRVAEELLETIVPVVSDLDDHIDELHQKVLSTNTPDLRRQLQKARQEVINYRRHIAPQRDALMRLPNETVEWMTHQSRVSLREIADLMSRYVEDLDAARERAEVAQDELNNQFADKMNRTMYLLTIISALLLPASLITGLFGINVGGMPGVENPLAFAVVAVTIPTLALAEYWLLRKLKWV